MVNNGGNNVNKNADREVGKVDKIKCNRCKTVNEVSNDEISTKNPNLYYKNCCICRQRMQDYIKTYVNKKKTESNDIDIYK